MTHLHIRNNMDVRQIFCSSQMSDSDSDSESTTTRFKGHKIEYVVSLVQVKTQTLLVKPTL